MKHKILTIIIGLTLILSSRGYSGDCKNKLSWQVWQAKFQQLRRSKHIPANLPHETVDIRTGYCNGWTPEEAADELGWDAIEFDRTWMPKVAKLAHIKRGDEALEEWLWFEYFLEGKTAAQAAKKIIAGNPYKRKILNSRDADAEEEHDAFGFD